MHKFITILIGITVISLELLYVSSEIQAFTQRQTIGFPIVYTSGQHDYVVVKGRQVEIKDEPIVEVVVGKIVTEEESDIEDFEQIVIEIKDVEIVEKTEEIVEENPVPVVVPEKNNVETVKVIEKQIIEKKVAGKTVATFEEKLIADIFFLTNEERKERGLTVFTKDPELMNIALDYSKDMIRRDFFSHVDPDGCDLECRYDATGYSAKAWAENIAYLENFQMLSVSEIAKEFMKQWMLSEGHKRNIVDDRYTNIGIGIYKEGNTLYASVEFSLPS